MIWRCLDSFVVLAAFAAIYIIPPLLTLRRFHFGTERANLLLTSAGLGISSQALLGFFWNHLVGRMPFIEGMLYFLVWFAVGTACQWRNSKTRISNQQPTIYPYFLPFILLAAITLRSLDALNQASLGQSDAYTHLQFLWDVTQYGQIRNIVYPPGYAWILALPVMTFNLDPYLVARYVGPFFGALLVVTLYLLGRRHSEIAGLYTAFLAAICPIFYPLIKTGMGAFANQMGLFLLPLALLLYLTKERLLFTLIILGLTVSVPLFVFTLLTIIILHRLLCFSTQQKWKKETLHILLPFLLAFVLAGYHFLVPGKIHLTTTASLVTGIETPPPSKRLASEQHTPILTTIKSNPIGKLAVDLLTVKRIGLGSALINAATLILTGLFTGILLAGFQRGAIALKLVGCWGLLTTLQVATGFLELSLYQRSGWVLMEALALAGGIIIAWLHGIERIGKFVRPTVGLAISAIAFIAFWIPPQHLCITSGAENELATVLRELSAARIEALHASPRLLTFGLSEASPMIARAAAAPHLSVVCRRYTHFNGDQGNLSSALLDPAAQIPQIQVGKDTRLKPPSDHFICLVDRSSGLPKMGILSHISPELIQSLGDAQPLLYAPNVVILAFLDSLSPESWRINQEKRGKNLIVFFVERLPRKHHTTNSH
jgi:hypothetical protein